MLPTLNLTIYENELWLLLSHNFPSSRTGLKGKGSCQRGAEQFLKTFFLVFRSFSFRFLSFWVFFFGFFVCYNTHATCHWAEWPQSDGPRLPLIGSCLTWHSAPLPNPGPGPLSLTLLPPAECQRRLNALSLPPSFFFSPFLYLAFFGSGQSSQFLLWSNERGAKCFLHSLQFNTLCYGSL